MKEKDLEKNLDNLIINGLIQEAEQDNADFEVAMRNMSDEDFLALIYDTVEDNTRPALHFNKDIVFDKQEHKDIEVTVPCCSADVFADNSYEDWDEWDAPSQSSNSIVSMPAQKGWKIWGAAIASVAAILLIVFVPAHLDMNSRLCESALLASQAYINPSRGIDISSMEKEEVRAMMPELEKQYSISLKQYRDQSMGIEGEQIGNIDDMEYYTEHIAPQESGLELVQAYLKLGMKDKAVKVLHELETNDDDPEFREYCRKMLDILE